MLLLFAMLLTSCGNEADNATAVDPPVADSPSETPAEADAGACDYRPDGTTPAKPVTPPPAEPAVSGKIASVIETDAGTFNVALDATTAPCTVNSFVALAKQGYFNDTQCHRLTTDGIWVLQCGDPTGTGGGGPGYSFDDELAGTETYPAGTVAMANAGPGTNGSQFFLVYKDSLGLPAGYTVFGKLDSASIRAVQTIAANGTANGTPDGAPKDGVMIQSVTIR
jgi:peptidyl-prolyl cis-trans isomerase B (cyclophilin B)